MTNIPLNKIIHNQKVIHQEPKQKSAAQNEVKTIQSA